jgi:hypothetical protein
MPEQRGLADTPLADDGYRLWRLVAKTRHGAIQPVLLLQPDTDARSVEIRLRWRRFPGARFQAYRIECREVGQQDDFSTIHRVESLGDTVFVDATVQPDARYVYQVVLEAAGQDWVSNRTGREGLVLSEVLILRAAADSSTGIINVSWSPYEGGGFEGYRVLRADPNAADATIFETADRADTSFADSTALSGVDYAYRVAVRTGEGELVSIAVAERLELPWVTLPLQAVEFTSLTASAALTWSPYAGPRFQAYHVERRTQELAPRIVARVEDVAVTSWVDTGLVGNTEYFYRVLVVTALGEELASGERSGLIHPLLQTWPLDIAPEESIRLYAEPDGRLRALLANESQVRMLSFGSEGEEEDEQVLWASEFESISARSAATALLADGSRVVSLRLTREPEDHTTLLHYDADGQPLLYDRALFADDFVSIRNVEVPGRVRYLGTTSFLNEITITSGGQVVITDDFQSEDDPGWDLRSGSTTDGRWQGSLIKADSTWRDVSLSTTGTIGPHRFAVQFTQIGNGSEFFQLQLSGFQARAILSFEGFDRTTYIAPIVLFPDVLFDTRLSLEDGLPRSSVSQPPLVVVAAHARSSHVSVAALENWVAIVDGFQPYTLVLGQASTKQARFAFDASEMRIWSVGQGADTRSWLGVCLADQHQVRYARTSVSRTTGRLSWSLDFSPRSLGTLVGQKPGSFVFPLSFDGAADGRVYVLDAGNARIQAFDPDGNYLTQCNGAVPAANRGSSTSAAA